MKRLLTDHKDITRTTLEDVPPAQLEEGQARLRVESFALTANNVTYAAVGFQTGYWKFFPTGVDGQGLVPVWGVAEVVESRSDALNPGTRLYGFYPLAEELVITPQADAQGMIVDAAPHRSDLPAVYNRYSPVQPAPQRQEDLRALLQPLLATSYLLCDWLIDIDFFGAEQVIVGSASSKTGLGLCKFLAEPDTPRRHIVGLTSEGNVPFVERASGCDQVLAYDRAEEIERRPSVFIDMAGNGRVKQAVHARLGDALKHSAAVGLSHWDKFEAGQTLEGVKPQFFFAPAQIAKRREEWGPGVMEKRVSQAWKRLAENAADWIDLRSHHGLSEAAEVYDSLAQGRANPRDGHIIRL